MAHNFTGADSQDSRRLNTVDIFVNGVSIATGTGVNSAIGIAQVLALGTDITGDVSRDTNFKGCVAELILWSRALADTSSLRLFVDVTFYEGDPADGRVEPAN